MFSKIKYFIPLAIVITGMSGLIYLAVQQNYRMSGNDPQIQLSEDVAGMLSVGNDPAKIITPAGTDIAVSLAPYLIVYDDSGKPVVSSAKLDGEIPNLPQGVFDYTKTHNQDRITWQPKAGVRSAIVVTRFSGSRGSGYVVSGRSLREVEKRIDNLGMQVGAAWMVTMLGTFLATQMVSEKRRK